MSHTCRVMKHDRCLLVTSWLQLNFIPAQGKLVYPVGLPPLLVLVHGLPPPLIFEGGLALHPPANISGWSRLGPPPANISGWSTLGPPPANISGWFRLGPPPANMISLHVQTQRM